VHEYAHMSNELLLHVVTCVSPRCYSIERDTFHRAKIAHEHLSMPAALAEHARAQSPAQHVPAEETAGERKYRGHRTTRAGNVAVNQDGHHMSAAEDGARQLLVYQVASVSRDAKEEAEEAQETEKTYAAEEMEEDEAEHSNCTTEVPRTSRDSPLLSPPRAPSLHPERLPAPAALTATSAGLMAHRETEEAEEAKAGGKLCAYNICVCITHTSKHEHARAHKTHVCVCACV
jgi:hypothetical protein